MKLLYVFAVIAAIQGVSRFAHRFPYAIKKLIYWLRALTLEVIALMGVMLMRFVSLFQKSRVAGPRTGRPILLIHGYMNGGFVWQLQERWLANLGFGPIYSINLGYPFSSIRTYVDKVEKMASCIAEETSGQPLTIIGHSMGGLVAAAYAAQAAPPRSIHKVITVGSPLFGTHMAKIGFGACAREMEIGSPLIQEVHLALKRRPDLMFYHILTKTDELVMPSSSCVLPGTPSERVRVFEDIGHASLLFSPRVASQLSEWLV